MASGRTRVVRRLGCREAQRRAMVPSALGCTRTRAPPCPRLQPPGCGRRVVSAWPVPCAGGRPVGPPGGPGVAASGDAGLGRPFGAVSTAGPRR
eukprot:8584870-Alexandrium_andersonii.AAC.1